MNEWPTDREFWSDQVGFWTLSIRMWERMFLFSLILSLWCVSFGFYALFWGPWWAVLIQFCVLGWQVYRWPGLQRNWKQAKADQQNALDRMYASD